MNLIVLNKSRRRLKAGDIFVMEPPDEMFLYGRIVSTEARIASMEGCILIYIYRTRSVTKLPVPKLSSRQLLTPPLMTNTLPWRRGYFETIAHVALEAKDILEQHCFKDSRGRYFDEANNELYAPVEPVGVWGLHSYRTIDDEVSKVLGIPLSA